jgi:hypothetical protein
MEDVIENIIKKIKDVQIESKPVFREAEHNPEQLLF